jgi:hypothetical protein
MTLFGIFWAGSLYLLPMDLTALRAAKFNVLLVNGFGLDFFKRKVVDGTAGALWTLPLNLIAFFLIHHCLLVQRGIILTPSPDISRIAYCDHFKISDLRFKISD